MFLALLLVLTPNVKQLKFLLADQWINKIFPLPEEAEYYTDDMFFMNEP